MRITYDPQHDAAYVYLRQIDASRVARTMPCASAAGQILNLDFDEGGKLVGIEAIPASMLLPAELLAAALARTKKKQAKG